MRNTGSGLNDKWSFEQKVGGKVVKQAQGINVP